MPAVLACVPFSLGVSLLTWRWLQFIAALWCLLCCVDYERAAQRTGTLAGMQFGCRFIAFLWKESPLFWRCIDPIHGFGAVSWPGLLRKLWRMLLALASLVQRLPDGSADACVFHMTYCGVRSGVFVCRVVHDDSYCASLDLCWLHTSHSLLWR